MMAANPHTNLRSLCNARRVWWGVLAVLLISPAQAQRLTLKRDLVIGALEAAPELEFQNIGAIGVASDGTLFVADGGSRSIRVFSRDGKFIRQWGRRGGGPGEFQTVRSILFHGDTVFTVDISLLRVTAFTREGTVLATWKTGPSNPNQAIPLAPIPGGWLVQTSHTPREWIDNAPRAGDKRDLTIRLGAVQLLGGNPDSLREIASYVAGHWVGIQVEGWPTQERPLFEIIPDHAADARGFVYISRGSPYRIDVLDPAGKTVRSLTRKHEPIEITPAMVNRYRANVGKHWDTVSAAGMVQPQMKNRARASGLARADLPMPKTIPPLGEVFVSSGGVVWVTRIDQYAQPIDTYFSRAAKQARPWDVFDANGAFIGSAQTPATFTLHAVTERDIIGVERDEFDVQYVVRYRFR